MKCTICWDTTEKYPGAECMADMLQAYGVTHVFHVPAVLRKTFAVMESRTSIKRLHVHSEATAAYMADGYARATGKPGICMAQVIGALNLAAGLRDAWLAHSPVIAFTGGREPKTKFRQVYQEVDDVPAFEPVTKFNATVDDVKRFPDMVRQAFRVATSADARGRCICNSAATRARSTARRRDGADDRAAVRAGAAVPPGAGSASVMAALKILQDAAAAGDRRRRRRARTPARRASWSRSRRRCTFRSRPRSTARIRSRPTIRCRFGVVGSYSRESANRVVNAADLVCFIGTETGGMTTHFWAVPKIGTPAIQIDIDPEALGMNYPLQARVMATPR